VHGETTCDTSTNVRAGFRGAGRKERRRFSLLSYRRFMGDYLDINGKSSLGSALASVCSIGGRTLP
jgi:hypothetical protein